MAYSSSVTLQAIYPFYKEEGFIFGFAYQEGKDIVFRFIIEL
jgi:hypothetical protein